MFYNLSIRQNLPVNGVTKYGEVISFCRKYGKLMLRRLEELLTGDGADTIYLAAEPVTGKPFWEAVGFNNTGEKLPENQFDIYKKIVG